MFSQTVNQTAKHETFSLAESEPPNGATEETPEMQEKKARQIREEKCASNTPHF
jgi:hypothetical protein